MLPRAGVQEPRVLVRHGEPFKTSATFACEVLWACEYFCSRTSLKQVHLQSMPYKLQRPFSKQGFLSVCKGLLPSPLPSPGLKQYGQFSHISTCITLCTSHNWSITVTGYIRCFSTYFLHKFYAINVT